MKVTAMQTTICRQLVAKTKLELFNRSNTSFQIQVFKCEESVNLAHYFPYDVKLRLLTVSTQLLLMDKINFTLLYLGQV